MMRYVRLMTWAMVLLGVTVGPALGQAEEVPFTATAEVVEIDLTDARVWTDEEGITHVRDAVVTILILVYDLEEGLLFHGDGALSLSYNINYANGNGDVKTWDSIEYSNDEITFTVEGQTAYETNGWVIENSGFNHHCREGEMAGMIALGEVFGIFGTPDRTMEGFMLFPQGAPLGSPDLSPVPIEETSWGSLKAQYR